MHRDRLVMYASGPHESHVEDKRTLQFLGFSLRSRKGVCVALSYKFSPHLEEEDRAHWLSTFRGGGHALCHCECCRKSTLSGPTACDQRYFFSFACATVIAK